MYPQSVRKWRSRRLQVVLAALSLASFDSFRPAQAEERASFTPLGFFSSSIFNSTASGVSGDGQVVTGSSLTDTGRSFAFLWTRAAGMVSLGEVPGGFDSSGSHVSGDGTVITGSTRVAGFFDDHVFRWTEATGMVELGLLPGFEITAGAALSRDGGSVAGWVEHAFPFQRQAFRWTASTGIVGLGWLAGAPSANSSALAVSADGAVIVGSSRSPRSQGAEAFRWTEQDGMVGLGLLPGSIASSADYVSFDGQAAAGNATMAFDGSSFKFQAYRWSVATGLAGLGMLPGANTSVARALSGDGGTVVGWSGTAAEAFRWNAAEGMVGLGRLPGDSTSSADFVSADGTIVVGDSSLGSVRQIFVWTPHAQMRSLRDLLAADGVDISGWSNLRVTRLSDDGRTLVGSGSDPAGHPQGWVVHIPNKSPVVAMGPNQTVNEGTAASVSGSASDADGAIVSYQWVQLSGPAVTLSASSSPAATFTAPLVTTDTPLTFQLTATDDSGASGSGTTTVLVRNVNQLPRANIAFDQAVGEGSLVTLSGSGSDPDGTIVSYAWTQLAGPVVALSAPSAPVATFTAPMVTADTNLIFRLTVTDNDGASASINTTVLVKNVNQLPAANAGAGQAAGEGSLVKLSGSGSDPDGTIVSYAWAQIGGPAVTLSGANSPVASFVAPQVAADTVLAFRLLVTDNEGATASAATSVTVRNIPDVVDLIVTSLSSSVTSIRRGRQFTVTYTIANQGTIATTSSFNTGIYLSADAAISTSDPRIGQQSTSALAAGASATVSRIVNVPHGLAPGTYRLGAIVDYSGLQTESNETNNALTGPAIQVLR